jgi:hypothetical protein
MKFDKAIPILESSDVAASIRYFVEQLKFDQHWVWGEGEFGGIVKENVEIFFAKTTGTIAKLTFAIVLDNVDEYYDLIKGSQAKILSPPETKEWSMREMWIECPDGHQLRIGHNTQCD